MIGGFLQASSQLGQEMAQVFSGFESDLAVRKSCGSVGLVVAVQEFWTGTGSLNRYPSSDGRSAFPLGSPPIFFTFASVFSPDRRSLAHFSGNAGSAFAEGVDMSSCLAGKQHNKEGYQECRLRNGLRVPCAPLLSQVVATRRLNKASSGRARARAQRSCWMATRSPALSSAGRPTCFTASSTPRVADTVAGLTPRASNTSKTDHRTLTRFGGFLLSEEPFPAGHCACGQEQEGT
jgi:hypothetical protein